MRFFLAKRELTLRVGANFLRLWRVILVGVHIGRSTSALIMALSIIILKPLVPFQLVLVSLIFFVKCYQRLQQLLRPKPLSFCRFSRAANFTNYHIFCTNFRHITILFWVWIWDLILVARHLLRLLPLPSRRIRKSTNAPCRYRHRQNFAALILLSFKTSAIRKSQLIWIAKKSIDLPVRKLPHRYFCLITFHMVIPVA